jgi:hypothetical protein
MEVNTREFEFSHGKKPRGSGFWIFFFDNARTFTFAGKYGDAVRAAKIEARQQEVYEIKVGP